MGIKISTYSNKIIHKCILTITAIPPDYQGITSTSTTISGGSGSTSGSGTYTSPIIKICDGLYSEIIFDISFLNCPLVKCIYDYLERTGSKTFCNNIDVFTNQYPNKPNLYLEIKELYGIEGQVGYQQKEGTNHVVLTLNKQYCNNNSFVYL